MKVEMTAPSPSYNKHQQSFLFNVFYFSTPLIFITFFSNSFCWPAVIIFILWSRNCFWKLTINLLQCIIVAPLYRVRNLTRWSPTYVQIVCHFHLIIQGATIWYQLTTAISGSMLVTNLCGRCFMRIMAIRVCSLQYLHFSPERIAATPTSP